MTMARTSTLHTVVVYALLASACVRLSGGTEWFVSGKTKDGRMQYTGTIEQIMGSIALGSQFGKAEKLVPLPRAFVLPLLYSQEAIDTAARIRKDHLGPFPDRIDVGRKFDKVLAESGTISPEEWRRFVFNYPDDQYDLPRWQAWHLRGDIQRTIPLDGTYRAYLYRVARSYESRYGGAYDSYLALLVSPDGRIVGKKGMLSYTRMGGIQQIILDLGVLMPG